MSELSSLPAYRQLQLLKAGDVSPATLAEHYQARITAAPELGAFVTLTPRVAEGLITQLPGSRGLPLWGLPHADKDLAVRPGVPTLFGSLAVAQALRLYPGAMEAAPDPVVAESDRLGLVSLGKTNTPEFGLYGYTESDVTAPARHPQDLSLNAGGSSGGAATAVAAGLLPAAIGSDGGGSVRIPAATVGLVGLKPGQDVMIADRGRSTPTGVVSGPLTRDTRDAALFFAAFSGQEATPWEDWLEKEPAPVRVGIAEDSPWQPDFELNLDGVVLEAMEVARTLLAPYCASQSSVSLKTPGYGALFQRAWFRAAASVPEMLNSELFQPTSRWLVTEGRDLSAAAIDENKRGVRDFRNSMAERLRRFDVILTPALGLGPQPVGSYPSEPHANFAKQVAYSPFTSWVNLMGWPAITVPVTRISWGPLGHELPFSVQLVGKPGSEWQLLSLARLIQGDHVIRL